jgi:diaminohydroxyphosphoribosylaminopyrimidine deaminase/5-amino-6-(5-phosphoribosylamino)uracil reductase
MTQFSMQPDAHWMRRAIRLAMNGRGRVEPNPMVGCVIVKDGRVIGEGYHQQFGGPHAEPNALANCTESPAGATAYVTLEPCCHTEKKTPPCVPRLIEAKVARVVIGCLDPNPEVNGKGLAQLRAAGIEVAAPVVEAGSKQLLAPFIAQVIHRRPYVTLKWAETADGKIAGPDGERILITGPESNRLVHELRGRSDAVLVGGQTLRTDDPKLTVRNASQLRPLLRIGLSARLRVPLDSYLVRTASQFPTLVYTSQTEFDQQPDVVSALQAAGVTVVPMGTNLWLSIGDLLQDLGRRGVIHLLVETGGVFASALMQSNHVDRVWIFRSSIVVSPGGMGILASRSMNWPPVAQVDVERDTLTEYLNPASPVYSAPEPSADFVLATKARDSR